MILSSLESYPLETTGLLFGIRDHDPKTVDYEVMHAVVHQHTQERDDETISENFPSLLRIIEGQNALTGMIHLGGFHSHPDENAVFSKEDKGYLKSKGIDIIEIVIGVEILSKADEYDLGWDIVKKGEELEALFPIGTQIYKFTIRAYRIYNQKIQSLELRSPYVEMLDVIYNILGVKSRFRSFRIS